MASEVESVNVCEAIEVGYVYPQTGRGVQNTSFSIAKNEILQLKAPSGAGKSTLLAIIAGLLKPSNGKVVFAASDPGQRQSTLILQGSYLFESLKVWENVALARGKLTAQTKAINHPILVSLGLEELAENYPNELSLGQRQRVAIAYGLASNPLVLLADEPTSNLDEKNSLRVLELFRQRAQQGNPVLIASHDPQVAKFADRVISVEPITRSHL